MDYWDYRVLNRVHKHSFLMFFFWDLAWVFLLLNYMTLFLI